MSPHVGLAVAKGLATLCVGLRRHRGARPTQEVLFFECLQRKLLFVWAFVGRVVDVNRFFEATYRALLQEYRALLWAFVSRVVEVPTKAHTRGALLCGARCSVVPCGAV